MKAQPTNFQAEQVIRITSVASPKWDDLKAHTVELEVVHITAKAVLVRAGMSEQWFPLSALTPSNNQTGVFLLARWVKLRSEWRCQTGAPRKNL